MTARSYQVNQANSKIRNTKNLNQRVVPAASVLSRKAQEVELLLEEIVRFQLGLQEYPEARIEQHSTIKNLISFSKQIITQMMRSNNRYRGYKVDTQNLIPSVKLLFLIGTLCEDFGYMNTSPLYGYNILDLGCGALSTYIEPEFPFFQVKKEEEFLNQFCKDHPPLGAEILQILGARVIGLDPRAHDKAEYEYQTTYKHRAIEFNKIKEWLPSVETKFEVISCLSLFNKYDFAYHYSTSRQIAYFLNTLRSILMPKGILYSDPPETPCTPEAREMNRRIFQQAGFRVIYEGYFYILEPIDTTLP
ncbi:MAG: hypothetical protein SFW36_20280 [Leptolyngbyaceae cyanobacterium bins.59]|nr:hypothetical protein [Leptolyngbyaceae cyanobacterium bins.59]